MVEYRSHVIHVVHIVTRTNIGGPSVILESLLADTSEEILYTVVRGETDVAEGDYFSNSSNDSRFLTIQGLGRSISPIADVRAIFQLITVLRSLRPDVVHTHMAKAGVVGRFAAWVARVPVRVHTYHGHLLYGYFSPLKTRVIVLIERLLNLITSHAVVVGSAVRADLINARIISEKHSEMIPPGIPDARLDVTPDRCGAADDKVLVGYVGRLVPIKRPDRFIDAAKAVVESDKGVEFVVVGDGPLGTESRARAKSTPAIRFVGWRRDIAPVLAGLDVVVLCSDNEGIPLSLIEASACGAPIVATNVGSVSDIVVDGTNGILVEPTVDALARGISQLLTDDQLRHQLGSAGRRIAAERFSMSASQERHRAMYQRLLNER
jgi:glycosyltransferase involved in cell wall biosynthesis